MWHLLVIGWLTVVSSVGGGQVMVDEQDGIKMHGKQISLRMEAGRHLIMVDKEGYTPYIDTVIVPANDTKLLAVEMVPQSQKTAKRTTRYSNTIWNYEVCNGVNTYRWVGIGGGIGSGVNIHVSAFDLRFGIFTIDPCIWGINMPFFSNVSHVQTPWLVHPKDRRSEQIDYEMAIPTKDIQLYYTPMIGIQLPLCDWAAITLSAGPQISWTHINWSYQLRGLPRSYDYQFTTEEFPTTGLHFDPVWFSIEAGILFTGKRSDLLTYFKYQDGYFLGIDVRF